MTETTTTLKVRDCMEANPQVINGLASVEKALQIMKDTGFDALVIDKRDGEDEYGLITIDAIAREVISAKLNLNRTSVYQIMEKPAVFVHATMKARYVLRLMSRLGIAHVIVTEDDHMVGVANLRCLSMGVAEDQRGV